MVAISHVNILKSTSSLSMIQHSSGHYYAQNQGFMSRSADFRPIIIIHMLQALQNKNQQLFFSTQNLPENLVPKLAPLVELLNSDNISIPELRTHLYHGICDEANTIRQFAWKIVLGYLPKDRKRWRINIQKQQKAYNGFINQFLPPQLYKDYPIIRDKNHPEWQHFEKDYLLWDQIEKDTCRTQAQLSFFSMSTQPMQIPFFTNTRREKERLIKGDNESWINVPKESLRKTYRYDFMTRILFIFARLNPKVEYVQGMNEILAPIFYIVNSHYSSKSPIQEAACFYMFNNVMTDLMELHIKDFGKKQNTIHERMRNISTMLLAYQPKTWEKLQLLKIDPFYYCFRWITLLFSQQFEMYETLRIWQSIFACQQRIIYVNCFALSLITQSRQAIAQKEYGQILSYFKNISKHLDLDTIISEANAIYAKYNLKEITELAERNKGKMGQEETVGEGNRLLNFLRGLF